MDEDFHITLVNISKELDSKNLLAMIFLCGQKLSEEEKERIETGLDLFSILIEKNLLSKDKLIFLKELLSRISRKDILIDELKITDTEVDGLEKSLQHISPYRSLLYDISSNIGKKSAKELLFLLKVEFTNLPELNETKCMMAVFSEMEKQKNPEDILQILKRYLRKIGRADLAKNIETYEEGLMDENTEISMAELSLTEQPEIYSMDRKHRGYCLIINNSVFVKHVVRLGTEKDAVDGSSEKLPSKETSEQKTFLTNVFTWLGMDVEIRNELSAQEIRDCLTEFSKKDHTERDCFVCCILTHGKSRAILGTDDEVIPISEIIAYFSPKNCTTLAGKPKLFFIQACQYSSCAERGASPMPNDADVLVGMSAMDGHYSIRHSLKGTWYIQALCENLVKMVPKGEDILSILTKVNKDVSEKEYFMNGKISMKQMPQPSYTLLKKLVFPKPPTPFKSPGQQANDF